MQPQGGGPDIAALLAQLGGGGGAPAGSPPAGGESPDSGSNWLVDAINSVHQGMVQESDPKQVSLLGAILNQLTTFQANAHAPKASGG